MLNFIDPNLNAEGQEGLKKNITVIAFAITNRAALTLNYDGGEKVQVEPFMLGVQKETRKYVMWCYKSYPLEFNDKKENWFLFELDKIQNLQKTAARAKNSRKKFFSLSADMEEIIVEVSSSK